jgi:hypothetical protein
MLDQRQRHDKLDRQQANPLKIAEMASDKFQPLRIGHFASWFTV